MSPELIIIEPEGGVVSTPAPFKFTFRGFSSGSFDVILKFAVFGPVDTGEKITSCVQVTEGAIVLP